MPTIKDIAPESVFTIELNAGTPGRQGPKGEQGIQGIQGPKGEPGPKPIRGIDYFTQQDISNMVTTITGNSNSVFNENVANKTKEFNANVSAKTSAFDNNAVLKTEEFNANANSKKTDFNLNANNRTTEFNTNASNKKNEIDTYVTNKTTEFDKHVENKVNEFKEETSEYVTENELESKGYLVESDLNDYAKEKDLFSGSYNDLKDKPKIPSKTSELTNDKGFINEIPREYVTEEEQEEFIKPYNKRITENEKYISDLEATIDILTNTDKKRGELVHITDALPLATFENKVDGNVEQETLEGTNYFDASIIVANGIDVIDNGKTIKMPISDKQGYTSTQQLLKVLCPNLKVGDEPYLYFTRSLGTKRNNYIHLGGTDELWHNETKKVITQEMLDGTVALYGNYATNDEETTQCILTDLRIVKEKDSPWEKFTNNQQTPNPDNPQEIEVIEGNVGFKVTGKNLIKNMRETATINGLTFTHNEDDSITVNGTATANTHYYFHSPVYGEALTFSKETLVTCSGITTGSTSTYRLVYNYLLDNVEKSGPIIISKERQSKLPAGAKIKAYIYVASGTTLNNVTFYPMIRLASDTDDTYEPYKEQIVYLDLKGNWVGKVIGNTTNFADYLVTDKKRLWLVKNIGKITLGNVVKLYTVTSGEFGTFNYGSFLAPNVLSKGRNYNFVCDRVHKANEKYSPYGGYLASSSLVVMADENDTLESFNAKLNGSILYYPLAEPQIIELGELPEPIKTFEGVNNIQLLANLDTEIEIKYGLDVKKYFENKLASIQEQIL